MPTVLKSKLVVIGVSVVRDQ